MLLATYVLELSQSLPIVINTELSCAKVEARYPIS